MNFTDQIIVGGLLFGAAIAFLATVFFIALYIFDPEHRRLRILKEKARGDYLNSRGSAHLIMLIEAQKRIVQNIQSIGKELSGYQAQLANLNREQSEEQRKLLEAFIIQLHINEIPGIGQKFSNQLARLVFGSRLSDLRNAKHIIQGIGEARQIQINGWVSYWENQIPYLLSQDFLGKDNLLKNYASKIRSISLEIKKLEENKTHLVENAEKCKEYIQKLKEVSTQDFEELLSGKSKNSTKIVSYQNGVFPEWEPMPIWFKRLISEK